MKTVKMRFNGGTDHYEQEFGPPLPRSLKLWGYWGCYEHENCLSFVKWKPMGTHLEEDGVTHTPVMDFWREHTAKCTGAPSCHYFVHWLVGELEEPGVLEQ